MLFSLHMLEFLIGFFHVIEIESYCIVFRIDDWNDFNFFEFTKIRFMNSSAHLLIGLFVFLILSCIICLYILEINPLSVASFVIIFSHSVCCLLIVFIVSFAVQKILCLIGSHFCIFFFYFHHSRR